MERFASSQQQTTKPRPAAVETQMSLSARLFSRISNYTRKSEDHKIFEEQENDESEDTFGSGGAARRPVRESMDAL